MAAPGGKGSASRTIESVATLAPTASADSYGVGINGATSPENHYSVDGLSVGNPGKGVLGTQLSSEFVEEVNVVTAGYMPEFGRSTGGILNVVTKSGSNEFHGGVWSYVSPGALEGKRERAPEDLTRVFSEPTLSYIGDFGLDLGGPILKDKLWFYAGFDVSNTKLQRRAQLPPHRRTARIEIDADLHPGLRGRRPHLPGHRQADLLDQRRQPADPGGLRHPHPLGRRRHLRRHQRDPRQIRDRSAVGRARGGRLDAPTAPAPTSTSRRRSTPRSSGTRSSWASACCST